MIVYICGEAQLTCDGCYKRFAFDEADQLRQYVTPKGRHVEVCSTECALKTGDEDTAGQLIPLPLRTEALKRELRYAA